MEQQARVEEDGAPLGVVVIREWVWVREAILSQECR